MDSTQIMLLWITALSALVLGIVSLYGIVMDIWFLIWTRGPRFLLGAAAYFMGVVFGALTAGAAIFILVLAGGNRG